MKSFEFEKVSIADAGREFEGQARQADEPSWTGHRTYQKNSVLLNTTLTWMVGLPEEVRPLVLARRFPRIANSIADLWRRVARCEDYLESLIVDRRGDRTGFPPDVAQELTKLRGFYAELHPDDRSAWNLADRRN
jgi:hypothetical protein